MRAWILWVCVLSAGCAQGSFEDAGPPASDASAPDGGRSADAGHDAGRDAGPTDAGPSDAGADASTPADSGPPSDAGPGVDAGSDAGPTVCPPTPGDVEISELMIASQTGSSDRGEWFEIHNRTGCPVDLSGLVINIGGATATVMSGLLTAGGYYVFAESADSAENHGLGEDFVYGAALRMGNGGGTLILTHGRTEVARVTWGSTDHRTGRSRQLSDGATMVSSVGGAGWCDSTGVYSMTVGGPYLGTPGMVNATCP